MAFDENLLIEWIIDKANSLETLERFAGAGFGKRIRNLVKERIRKIKKEQGA